MEIIDAMGEVFDAFFCGIYVLLSSKNDSVPVNAAEPEGASWYMGWKHNFIVLGSMDGTHITQYNVRGLPYSEEMRALFHSL